MSNALDRITPLAMADSPQITQLMHAAIEKGASVETLEKLVGLYERVENRLAAREFTDARMAFQMECKPLLTDAELSHVTRNVVTRDGRTVSKSARYATLAQICRTVNPILWEHGFSYGWDSSLSDDGSRLKVWITLTHVGGHSATSTFEAPIEEAKNRAGDRTRSWAQDTAVVRTFAERQTLVQVLGLYTVDPDTDAAPSSSEKITEEQVNQLNTLMREVGYKDPSRLYTLMGIKRLPDLPRVNYEVMVRHIEAKRVAP